MSSQHFLLERSDIEALGLASRLALHQCSTDGVYFKTAFLFAPDQIEGGLKSKCNTVVVYWMVCAESSSLASQAL